MSSAKAMYDKLQTVKTSGSKTPISDFKSVDLLADKKYMLPCKSATTFGSVTSDNYKWQDGVLAPNGKIYGIPYNSTTVLEIDPVARTATSFGSLTGTYKWISGVLAPNGKIYGIPANSTTVLEIDTGCIGDFPWALQPYVNKY